MNSLFGELAVEERANFVPGSENEVNLSTMCVDVNKLAD
jgi:hypothetical protein